MPQHIYSIWKQVDYVNCLFETKLLDDMKLNPQKQLNRERKSVILRCHLAYFQLFVMQWMSILTFSAWNGFVFGRRAQSCLQTPNLAGHQPTRSLLHAPSSTRPLSPRTGSHRWPGPWHGSTPRGIVSSATATSEQISRVPHPVKCALRFALPRLSATSANLLARTASPDSLLHFPPFLHILPVSSLHPLLPSSDVFATLGSLLCWICHLSLFFHFS